MSVTQQKKVFANTAIQIVSQYDLGLISFEEMFAALTALVVEHRKEAPEQDEVTFRLVKMAPADTPVVILNKPFARSAA